MKVNEIFYSLQGEGTYTGTPAVFLRFAHCNLHCAFCDTEFEKYTEMTEEEIITEINHYPATHVVITGGEPTLQLTPTLIHKLHTSGHYMQIETNGTRSINGLGIDFITCSPKFEHNKNAEVVIERIDELKVVYMGQDMIIYDPLIDKYQPHALYLQPCDTGDDNRDTEIIQETVEYIKQHPQWKLSLQTQKILNVR